MTKPANEAKRATVCLSMIVKNEAHVVHECLESAGPYIDYWVIVDTGSTDGTQAAIHATMQALGIPGELLERPWRNFGYNRTEALELAQGHCDYILLMDADDVLDGEPDLNILKADAYLMQLDNGVHRFGRLHLFRDGLPWRFIGATHEYATCDEPYTADHMPGDCRILYRGSGSNSTGLEKLVRDRDLLLTAVADDANDSRSVFYLALTYNGMGDYAEARRWFERRTAMQGFDEEVYYSKLKLGEIMERLGEPWPDVQATYLDAWAFRPIRAEALYEIAFHYRCAEQYELGYLFASRGAQIPLPQDIVFVQEELYNWRLLDEQAVCASWIGRSGEALTLYRRVLTLDDTPEDERQRILANRDALVNQRLQSSATYPTDLARRPSPRRDAEVTVTLSAGSDSAPLERTLNSFLRCCSDHPRVGRVLVIDAGLAAADREALAGKYPFLDFLTSNNADLNVVRREIGGRYWLHLWHGWQFFSDEALITRLIDVLETEPSIHQIGINLRDASRLGPDSPARSGVRTTASGYRYVLSDTATAGPAMFDMTRLRRLLEEAGDDFEPRGPTATLDEVLCVHNP